MKNKVSRRAVSRDWWKRNKHWLRMKIDKSHSNNILLNEYSRGKEGGGRGRRFVYVCEEEQPKIIVRLKKEILSWISNHKIFENFKKILIDKIPVADRRIKDACIKDFSSKEIEEIYWNVKTRANGRRKGVKEILKYLEFLIRKRKREERLQEKHHLVHENRIKKLNDGRKYLSKQELKEHISKGNSRENLN